MTMAFAAELPRTIGPYRLEGVLGRGATSTVYRARAADPAAAPLALKLLDLDTLAEAERPGILARFHREAALCRRLEHPNIVRVHDAGDADGRPFLAMTLLDGRPLGTLLRGAPLPPARALGLALQLLDALAHAHARGIVHRDVKPDNLILGPEDHLTLVDFGIAHQRDSDLTLAGDMLGTPAWMAPEQIAGAPVDHRADLFAAGAVLFALLTGQRPFAGTVAGVMQAILHRPTPQASRQAPGLPPALNRILEQAMAKAPQDRHASAAALAAALRSVLPMLPLSLTATPPGPAPPADPDTTLRPSLAPRLARAHATAGHSPLAEAEVAWLERALRAWTGPNPALERSLAPLLAAWPGDLARLVEIILAEAPLPEVHSPPRGDWMVLVRLAAVSLQLLARMGEADLARAHRSHLAEELAEPFLVHLDRVGQRLARSETPDLDRLSMGLFRLDVLELALETLGAGPELRLARKMRTLVAIQAMRRVNEAVASCTRGSDRIARFDVALIMAELEALISIAGRLTDADGPPAGRHLSAVAAEVVGDFIAGAGALARMTAAELRAYGATAELRVFTAKLRQLGALSRFAARLPGQQHRAAVARLAETMRDEVGALARGLMGPGDNAAALSAIHDLAESLGWHTLSAEILRHLQQAARDAGAG